jgi:hypothetical protein
VSSTPARCLSTASLTNERLTDSEFKFMQDKDRERLDKEARKREQSK